ncbi:N-acetylmuramoyl-L-alanine amidase [Natranaerofaba carboxydovora]|uniref:N-acetylmuramoyl-L-alanine amidase n=1 Tax=Natranaerofaba carboxydovora TaxID=2742683 RepID=UPI001F128CA5|nr:N-acetylmuramoyl-L-alanine amidase [Natranaerofaba carboxydovora]UMZ75442.1 N-acetylmuramoyl-L-alanine amidase LytC [Natranaerofaba carboxydovora]
MKSVKAIVLLMFFLLVLSSLGTAIVNAADEGQDQGEAFISASTLNVRSGPGTDYSKLGEVHVGESYHIVDEHTDSSKEYSEWVKISLPENFDYSEGWVSADYVNSYAPLQGISIALDPGHGGPWDPGAVGPTGLTEKEVALDVSLRLENLLEDLGAEVYMTRETDIDVPLWSRVNTATWTGADMFISIHANGSYNRGSQGTETYYSNFFGYQDYYLAASLQNSLVNHLGRMDRGVLNGNHLYILNRSTMPSALVELAFMTNYDEEYLLSTDYFRQSAAQGLTEGIVSYVYNYHY